MPKRYGHLYNRLYTDDNLWVAYNNSRHGKSYVDNMLRHKEFDERQMLRDIKNALIEHTYRTSRYTTMTIHEPKERLIFRLPYNPDRVVHHVIMNIMEPIWTNLIPNTSYSCIKGRGIIGAYKYVKRCLCDKSDTKYCLKMDIKKFFPSVNHEQLFNIVSHNIKDPELLCLLHEIITSTDRYVQDTNNGTLGYNLPIGNYLSQFFANIMLRKLYLVLINKYPGIKIVIYMDDIVILSSSKSVLHEVLHSTIDTLMSMDLTLKGNYQIFPVAARGIDFCGFRFYHDHVDLRRSLFLKIRRLCLKYKHGRISRQDFYKKMASYKGWIVCANSKKFCDWIYRNTGWYCSCWRGDVYKLSWIKDKYIKIVHIEKHKKYFCIQAVYHGRKIIIKSKNTKLLNNLLNQRFFIYTKLIEHI